MISDVSPSLTEGQDHSTAEPYKRAGEQVSEAQNGDGLRRDDLLWLGLLKAKVDAAGR